MSKGTLWIMIGACIALTVLGGVTVYHFGSIAFHHRIHSELQGVAKLKIQQIAHWYNDAIQNLNAVSSNEHFVEKCAELVSARSSTTYPRLHDWLRIVRRQHGCHDVVLVTPEILPLADASDAPITNAARKRWKEALAASGDTTYVTDLYIRSSGGDLGIDFLAPVRYQGRVLAILILKMAYSSQVQTFVEYWPTQDTTAETFILGRDGNDAIYLNNLRHRPGSALRDRMPLSATDVPGVRAVLGDTGIVNGVDYRGIPVIAYIGQIPGTPWALVAKIDRDEVYAPLRDRAWAVGGMVGLLAGLMSLSLFFFYRSRQLETDLYVKRSEQALSRARNFFETSIASMADAVIITDASGQVMKMNNTAEQLTGWTEQEAMGAPLSRVFPLRSEDTGEMSDTPVDRILRDGVVVGLANHTLLVTRSGENIPILDSGAPIRDESGRIIGIVLVFRDQSAERAAQRAVAESESKYRSLVEVSTDAILVNQDDRFVYCNRAAIELFGAKNESDILGTSPYDLFHPDYHEKVRARILSMRESGRAVERAHERILHQDGSVIDVDVIAVPFDYQGSQAIHVVLRDISERLATRRRLVEALESAEKANNVKSLFLTNISHELRTPLNNILGYNTLIREQHAPDMESEAAEYFAAVEESGDRLLRTMHSILEITRIQSGTYGNFRNTILLPDVLDHLTEQYRAKAAKKRIAFVFIGAAPEATITADNDSLQIALTHLIDNAVRFTDSGGVTLRLSNNGEGVVLEIRDTGVGMSEEYLERMREPFTQESEGFTKKYQGLGLGLSIAIHHLEANGVQWEVHSRPGAGTTFRLRFS